MNAADWRPVTAPAALDVRGDSALSASPAKARAQSAPVLAVTTGEASSGAPRRWHSAIRVRHVAVVAALLIYPFVASPFFTFQIAGQALVLGIIALSLTFLAGSGGMVSLAQMTVAGVAGYLVAIFGSSASPISLHWPWWLAVPLAILVATAFATFVGWLAVRTEGIYTIMITLAIGAAFYFFTNQNYALFNGHTGMNSIETPVFWGVDWRASLPFYYLTLGLATLCYFAIDYLGRAPFGLALQGVRDNPRRMAALGFHVNAHRIAAYTFAAFLAALGGILQVWNYKQISPGSVGVDGAINILIIAAVGGITRPVGPFIGAFIFVLLRTFAIDFLREIGLDGNRF